MSDHCSEPGLMTLQQGLDTLLGSLEPSTQTESVPIAQALNRILAQDIQSAVEIPPFRNSYMDGYALQSAYGAEGQTLQVVGTSWAGRPYNGAIEPGQCIRIFTGAKVPDWADCVIMQEHVTVDGDQITLHRSIASQDNLRYPGDDVKPGQHLFDAGHRLGAADLGVLASIGCERVEVTDLPRVAFFSTGDELVAVDQALGDGQIHDSNRYLLTGLLAELGLPYTDLGVVPDRAEAVESALVAAAKSHAVILSSGGASVGDADFIVDSIRKLGQLDFWKLAMRPGKPLVVGRIQNARFFGLPGNPVSVFVNFMQVVKPALFKLMGAKQLFPLRIPARSSSALRKEPGRMEFQRGHAYIKADGLWVESTGNQGSHVLSSVSRANCLIVLDQDAADVAAGDTVQIEFFQNPLTESYL